MIFNKNDKIGLYTVAFPHKQGIYAETYRVKDPAGKTRFLKLINYSRLNRHQIDDNGQITEIEIVKQCQHHNLCRYVDSGNLLIQGGQYAYLVTEFISGETWTQRLIREENASVYEIKQTAKAVLSALGYLHALPTPVIHGEVSLQNIMLNMECTSQLKPTKTIRHFLHSKRS